MATSAGNSSVEISAPNAPADGETKLLVTVTLLDGDSEPVADHTVTLTTTAAGVEISDASGQSDLAGVVTFEVSSAFVHGAAEFVATDTTEDPDVEIAQTVEARFYAPAGEAWDQTIYRAPRFSVEQTDYSDVMVAIQSMRDNGLERRERVPVHAWLSDAPDDPTPTLVPMDAITIRHGIILSATPTVDVMGVSNEVGLWKIKLTCDENRDTRHLWVAIDGCVYRCPIAIEYPTPEE